MTQRTMLRCAGRMLPLPDGPVFDRAAAHRCGWSDSALTRAARAGRIVRLRRGQFALPDRGSARVEALAAQRCVRGSALSHRSALVVHGLPVVGIGSDVAELTVAPRGTSTADRARVHRATLFDQDVVVIDGATVLTVARTLVDVARSRPAVTSVPAIDAALHLRLVGMDEIDDVLRRCWNWPGIARAHRALRLVDGRAESALESVSRLVMGWMHLPVPDLQPVLRDPSGFAVARLDFYWDAVGVAGEADGRSKYAGRGPTLEEEKDRQERAEDLGVQFARWGWELAWRRPRTMRHKIECAFERGRARDRSGLPRGWTVTPRKPVV